MAGKWMPPKTEVLDLASYFILFLYFRGFMVQKLLGKEKMRLKSLVMAQINRISPLKNWFWKLCYPISGTVYSIDNPCDFF